MYATVLNNLAGLHHERGAYAAARTRYEEALDVLEAIEGRVRRSDAYATTLANLGVLYHGMARFEDAESSLDSLVRTVGSSYHDETEKNLGRIVDRVGTSSAILLFDEADAPFGRRSEVEDSDDEK